MGISTQDFGTRFYEYPIMSQDDWSNTGSISFDSASKRFTTFPQPSETLSYALMGLPKVWPLTGEPITTKDIEPFLNSAATELEMDMGMNLLPVQLDQSFDYVDGLFTSNAFGMKLQQWPATKVIQVQLRFPHTQMNTPYNTYTIPPQWVALRRNRVNVMASFGAVSVQTNSSNAATAAGIFSYIYGFQRGAYQPAIISVQYMAGFEPDRLPFVVADLIKTWAAWRFLTDAFPGIAPITSTSVALDGISQSASLALMESISKRIEEMDKKRQKLMNAITKAFGRTIKMGFIGA